MTNAQKIVFCFVVMMSIAAGGMIGIILEDCTMRSRNVANGCAYYDMTTGDFTYGVRPLTISAISSPYTKKEKN